MRTVLAGTILLAAALGAADASDLPQPAACADYGANITGSDPACDAAIAKETDPATKSVLLFRRAYMEVSAGGAFYAKALADLDESIRQFPTNFMALHERAYLYNEYGRWADALKDIDAQIALAPQRADGYRERALSLFNLGDLQGTFDDRNTVVMLDSQHPGPLIGRAIAAMWIGRFDAAGKDLDAAAALAADDAPATQEIDRQRAILALLTKTSGRSPAAQACNDAGEAGTFDQAGLVGDCTRAFLDAKTPKEKSDALTVRAVALALATQNESAGLGDYTIAAALTPADWGVHSNLAFAYMYARHSQAAVAEFDKSIKFNPGFLNLAGRAAAKLNLQDIDGAFADAKKSFEIQPNELALIVLGDCTYAKMNSYDQAKGFWIAAYRMGDHNDELIARLKDAGVPIPPPPDAEDAKP